LINENGVCDCCGKIVARNKKTGKVYTKEELETEKNKKVKIYKFVIK